MPNDPTEENDDPLSQSLDAGDYDPPGAVGAMQPAWLTDVTEPDGRAIYLHRAYLDLVTDDDWQQAGDTVRAATLRHDLSAYTAKLVALGEFQDSDPRYPSGPVTSYNFPMWGNIFFAGDAAPSDPNGDGGKDWSQTNRRFLARFNVHWKWCAYLTRCKLGMARATQFEYAPDTEPFSDLAGKTDLMAYNHISSWQRVNAYMRSSPHARDIEGNAAVTAAATRMDTAMQQFASATGVTQPQGATSVPGHRFPVSGAWWEGRIPAWKAAAGGPDPQSTLDTRQIANDYQQAAHDFRQAVGGLVTYYKQQDRENQS